MLKKTQGNNLNKFRGDYNMALKPGRIYQEMIEVPDEPAGCGCLGWIIAIIAIIVAGLFLLNYIFSNPIILILGFLTIVAISILRMKR